MNKNELSMALAERTGLSRAHAGRAVDAVLEELAEELSSGGRVVIAGFGTFFVHRREAHTARVPSTGEEIAVPARRFPSFRPGTTLRSTVSG